MNVDLDIADTTVSRESVSPFHQFISEFRESRVAVAAFIVLLAIVLVAALAPWISPQDPYDLTQLNIRDARLPPSASGSQGTTYWLGTDDQGRDMLSAILFGLWTSILVGAISGAIALAIGISVGLVGAYFKGLLDSLLMRLVDIQLGFPPLLVAIILIAVTGPGFEKVIAALIVAQWAFYARTVRAVALVEQGREYIEAAEGLGLNKARILFRHLLPNCLPPLIVVAMVQIAHAILLEATLSFLGVGLPITEPSLGLLIANGYEYIFSGRYWISFYPGVALLILILSINLVGDQLRDILNPRLRR